MKKVLTILITLAIGYCLGYLLGRYDIYKTVDNHICTLDYREAYLAEKAIASASLELNHLWYSSDDNDYWYDVVVNTKEYQRLDSALNQDWEDFYMYETPLMWESITYRPNHSYN